MKKLKLKINDKDYTLEMTRDSIKWLEAMGFTIEEFDKKPITFYDLIWTSLFLANNKDVYVSSYHTVPPFHSLDLYVGMFQGLIS